MTTLDWRRAVYAVLALPAYLGGARAQRWLAWRVLGVPPREGRPRLAAALGTSVLAFVLAMLIWYLVGRIATYGLFWDPATAGESWGGPGLAGAWIVHFFCAFGMTVPAMWLLRPLTEVQLRLLPGRTVAEKRTVAT
ncbi:hypothetical protein GCM10022222_17710 [Amycolatopsis ultiminotia]|uniref:Uncharacterized protein n=1 Tax=Amycolatopsis ultiminotia TaxID=543629 RepID=A0ABP6VGS3_9PSEU